MKAIVTTTINPPTEAIHKFIEIAERDDWKIFIVGDHKTPHEDYIKLCAAHDCVAYLTPEKQEQKYKELSDLIGWGCIQRRNIGFIEAYNLGAEIIATIDDDNIPYENWGQKLAFGQKEPVALFHSPSIIFDPLSVNEYPKIWHRGFPLELLPTRSRSKFIGRQTPKPVMVQADLWDGEPDVDAIARVALGPFDLRFREEPFTATKPGPFNSQNTFLHRDCFPDYFLFPHVGRMDDIWASYVLQSKHRDRSVIYGQATVYQERNVHNLARDIENEMIGYKNTLAFVTELFQEPPFEETAIDNYLPERSRRAYEAYKACFKKTPESPNT